jgi:hypothetical protein
MSEEAQKNAYGAETRPHYYFIVVVVIVITAISLLSHSISCSVLYFESQLSDILQGVTEQESHHVQQDAL